MRHSSNILCRTLAALLIAGLLLASLPCAMAEEQMAIVTSKYMYVAADANGRQVLGRLAKNTLVTVLSTFQEVAKIQYKGRVGFARLSDMKALDSVSGTAVVNMNTYAFQKPNTRSARVKVKQGTSVNVLAVNGAAAMVEKGGVIGYMYRSHLTLQGEGNLPGEGGGAQTLPQQPVEPSLPSLGDAYVSGNYSNEQLTYLFLVQVMGYNTAAAAGVLANIDSESDFNPTLGGDSGSSYGICQWHAERKKRLSTYCENRNYDMSTLPAQLLFLKYELETYYPKVNNYLKGVSDTAQGAYDAGYYFCYHFEAPSSRESRSAKRGATAQSTYYPKYAVL